MFMMEELCSLLMSLNSYPPGLLPEIGFIQREQILYWKLWLIGVLLRLPLNPDQYTQSLAMYYFLFFILICYRVGALTKGHRESNKAPPGGDSAIRSPFSGFWAC